MPGPDTSSSSNGEAVGFVTWADRSPTGGNVYNAELIAALRAVGTPVRLHQLPGRWPSASPADRRGLLQALHDESIAVIDGIVAGGAPEEITEALAAERFLAVLVHLPLVDEVGVPPAVKEAYRQAEGHVIRSVNAVLSPSQHGAA